MTERTTHTITIFPTAADGEELLRQAEADDDLDLDARVSQNDPLRAAQYLVSMGRPASALRSIQRVVSDCDDREVVARCCVEAGRVRESLGEFDAARSCYREALALEPRDAETRYFAHNNLGYCLNRLGRSVEAEASCRQAIAIDDSRHNAHKNLGIALESRGQLAEAASAYAIAVRAKPGDPRALRRLRILLARNPELIRDQPSLLEVVPGDHAVSESVAQQVERLLASIRVDEPVAAEGLQVFGLRWDVDDGFDYRTLDEALTGGALDVTEVSEQGQVPFIKVHNHTEDRVFLMAGEELVGAKQNRVLNASILVGSRSEMPLPVSCVERGRWAHRARGFATAGTSSHSALRYAMLKDIHASYRRHGSPHSDQAAVWREVERKMFALKSQSPSNALHETYVSMKDRLDEVSGKIAVHDEWSGAVFAFGGVIVGLDLFDRAATFSKLWPKLIRAYAIDALEGTPKAPLSRGQVEEWLGSIGRPAMEAFPSPGLGTDVRIESDRMIGAALMVDDHPVHVEIFAHEE